MKCHAKTGRLAAVGIGVLVASLNAGPLFAQEDFPSKPIIMVVAGGVGGGADIQARLIADAIDRADVTDQPVAVLNRGTAVTPEAYRYTLDRPGDAHYLLSTSNSMLTFPMLGDAGFVWQDFTPVANLVFDPIVVVVSAASELHDLDDLVALATERQGNMTFGGGQIGTQDHMGFLELVDATGIEGRYVGFSGGAETHRNLLGSQIDVAVGNPSDFLQSVEAGSLRVIATLDTERSPAPVLADVPTAIEQGFDANFVVFRGWVAPPEIDEGQRDRLVELLDLVTEDDAFIENYVLRFGMRPVLVAGDDFHLFLEEQEEVHREKLRAADLIE